MKTDQHVSQIGSNLSYSANAHELFRIAAEASEDSAGVLSDVRAALLDLASTYPLPAMPPDAEKEVRSAAQMVITGVMTNAGAPGTLTKHR